MADENTDQNAQGKEGEGGGEGQDQNAKPDAEKEYNLLKALGVETGGAPEGSGDGEEGGEGDGAEKNEGKEEDPEEGDGKGKGEKTTKIGGKEYTPKQLQEIIDGNTKLQKQLDKMKEDGASNKEVMDAVKKFIDKQSEPAQPVLDPEQIKKMKEEYAEAMEDDPVGVVLELSGMKIKAMMEGFLKPLVDRITELESGVGEVKDHKTKTDKETKMIRNVSGAFKKANQDAETEYPVTKEIWSGLSKFADEQLGLDVNALAEHNPKSLAKITTAYLKMLKVSDKTGGKSSKPGAGKGMPSRGGAQGSKSQKDMDVDEKAKVEYDKMKRMGLLT